MGSSGGGQVKCFPLHQQHCFEMAVLHSGSSGLWEIHVRHCVPGGQFL